MRRRGMLWAGVGLLGAGTLAWANRNPLTRALITRRENEGLALTPGSEPTCRLTPEQIEGPFFFDAPLREDITEGRPGVPLELTLSIRRGPDCEPFPNARVDIWHCDAAGRYSGYPEDLARKPFDTLMFLGGQGERVEQTNAQTYLRGAQISDAEGMVRFQTIVPGWYAPRVPHIHVKVHDGERSYLTTQLYLPDAFCAEIFERHTAYADHGLSPYRHENDAVLAAHLDAQGLLLIPEGTAEARRARCRLTLPA